jgi:hypothetical protein
MARLLAANIRTVADQENDPDPPLSVIHNWAEVLGVPVSELLVEPTSELSTAVGLRATLVNIMRSVRSLEQLGSGLRIKTRTDCASRMKIMIQNLIQQLLELMPELVEINAWPSVGCRLTGDDEGRIAQHPIHVSPALLSRVDVTPYPH